MDTDHKAPKKKRELRCLKTYDFEEMAKKAPESYRVSGEGGSVVRRGGVRWHRDQLTIALAAKAILAKQGQMTLRGLYYALFGEGWIPNSQEVYKGLVIPSLVEARKNGIVPWDAIDDLTRVPATVQAWDDLADFMETVKQAYRRNVWNGQDVYIEAWLEKRTGVAQAKAVCQKYGVTVNAGNGYDGWSSIYEAAVRYGEYQKAGKTVHVLYIGDFDPSGLHMFFNLQERLGFFIEEGTLVEMPKFQRLGVNDEDIEEHDLPQAPGKESDSRADWMRENYGKVVQVEMDALWALDTNEFQKKLKASIEDVLDMQEFAETVRVQKREVRALEAAVDAMDLTDDGEDEGEEDDGTEE